MQNRRSCVHQPSAFSLPWARRAFPRLRTPSTPRRCLPKFHTARSARDKHRSTPCGPLPLSFHHARHAVFSPVTLQQSLTPLPSLCPGPCRMSSRRCWTVGPSPSTLPAVALNKSLASAAGAPVAILELRVINTAPIREWTKMLYAVQRYFYAVPMERHDHSRRRRRLLHRHLHRHLLCVLLPPPRTQEQGDVHASQCYSHAARNDAARNDAARNGADALSADVRESIRRAATARPRRCSSMPNTARPWRCSSMPNLEASSRGF